MTRGSIRRAQLIAPFGTGAISVAPDGTALVTAGLDYWYQKDGGTNIDDVDIEEFEIEEWRLQGALRVRHLRIPPDYRRNRFGQHESTNMYLTVPCLRFPRWNFCRKCRALEELPLSFRGRQLCSECQRISARTPLLAQVPFIAICDYGHLQDFPWREWVHRSVAPTCSSTVRLRSGSGASLADQWVSCDCGKERNLGHITEAAPVGSTDYPKTYLSSQLDQAAEYVCRGSSPWNGSDSGTTCGRPVRGSLRAASNVYYALVKSSIYLPQASGNVPAKLLEILEHAPMSTAIKTLRSVDTALTPELLRRLPYSSLLSPFSDVQIAEGLAAVEPAVRPLGDAVEDSDELGDETAFRRPEFEMLRQEQDSPELCVSQRPMREYGDAVLNFFGRIMLVEKLRETRALWGFTRIYPDATTGLHDRKSMLWETPPSWDQSWLPAYAVHGEGVLLELDEDRLRSWESQPSVLFRIAKMQSRFEAARGVRHLRERPITARFVLLHTFAHILMNQLTFDCGYSSASLRERLYVSSGPQSMAAVLIYTAAGDSDGTMGGLVRMGKPGYLEDVIADALVSADWCSSDTVCMELGESGQGPDSCNLAACHSCALVPETACEEFNRFLDRAAVVGTLSDPQHGYFK